MLNVSYSASLVKWFFLIALCCLFAASCKKNNPKPTGPPAVDVYVGGDSFSSSGAYIPTYWKNGVRYMVQDTSTNSYAYSMAVSGQDVYFAGEQTSGQTSYAVYWKNGVAIQLLNVSSNANAIAASNGSVYIAGNIIKSFDNGSLVYWKDGAITNINEPVNDFASAMTVQGSDVYIAGYIGTTTTLACYWKNGIIDTLSTTASISKAIAVEGNDVYAAGIADTVPVYWKNGTEHQLPLSFNIADVAGMAVSGGDVYVCGTIAFNNKNQAIYWKNNVATTLSYGSSSTIARAIAVNGNDVYVAGDSLTDGVPVIWKNGVPMALSGNNAVANSLVLVPR